MTNEKELLRGWFEVQSDPCMCLGDCEKCNFHACHGCLCWIEKIVAEAMRRGQVKALQEEKARVEKYFAEEMQSNIGSRLVYQYLAEQKDAWLKKIQAKLTELKK